MYFFSLFCYVFQFILISFPSAVTLKQIRQIPGVKNVITTLFGKQAGERWLPEEIAELKRIVEDAGLGIAGIESVNVSDDIKIGTAKADEHIDNYIMSYP